MKIKLDLELKDFEEMSKLEERFYDLAYITPANEAFEWYKKNAMSTVALYEGVQLVGFCNVFPIKKNVFDAIERGEFNDSELTYEHMLAEAEYGEAINLFFSCIAISESYRSKEVIQMLLDTCLDYYDRWIESGVRIRKIIMDTVTPEGAKFAKRCGLEFLRESHHESRIYGTSYKQFASTCRANKRK